MAKKLTLEEIITKFEKVHSATYRYDKVVYNGKHTKVCITCRTHGDFWQSPHNHQAGKGCPKCADNFRNSARKLTQDEVIRRAKEVHGDKYTYSDVVYTGVDDKIVIHCNGCRTSFTQTPYKHINVKQGCPTCAFTGFDRSKPAVLYYLKVCGGKAYKIGITTKTVHQRYSAEERRNIEILSITEYANGADAYKEEQKILEEFKEYKYEGMPLLKAGNTELFYKDVLGEDYE